MNVKKDFLMKKGLTEAEIDAALALVETATPQPSAPPPVPPLTSVQNYNPHVPPSTIGTKIRDLLTFLLLIGGFSYGARYLWKVNFN